MSRKKFVMKSVKRNKVMTKITMNSKSKRTPIFEKYLIHWFLNNNKKFLMKKIRI